MKVELTPENVGSKGVEVIGDTPRMTLPVSLPKGWARV